MSKNPVATALAVGGVLLMSACASSSANSAADSSSVSASASPSPSASAAGSSTPAAAACQGATPMAGSTVNVTASDEGHKLCVSAGTELVVLLKGTTTSKWTGIHSSSPSILVPQTDPSMMLQSGWAGAAFRALRPGTAYISASRFPCRSSTTRKSQLQCGVIVAYRVDIVVASSS